MSHLAGVNLMRPDIHDESAHDSHQNGCRKRHQRHGRQAAHDVVEQPLDAAGENLRFALFGVIALDDAHAAQRLREASGNLRADFAPFAEDGPDGFECLAQGERRRPAQLASETPRHQRADPEQQHQCDHGGQYSADELDHAGADQVAHAFDIRHDARHQLAGLVRIVVSDRQAADVLLNLAAQFRDQFLAFDGKQLSQRKRGDALNAVAPTTARVSGSSSPHWCLPITLSRRIAGGSRAARSPKPC